MNQDPNKIDVSLKALLTDGFSFLFLSLEIHYWRNWAICLVVSYILGFAELFNMFLCPSVFSVNSLVDLEVSSDLGSFFFLFDEVMYASLRKHLMSACLSLYATLWRDLLAQFLRISKIIFSRFYYPAYCCPLTSIKQHYKVLVTSGYLEQKGT